MMKASEIKEYKELLKAMSLGELRGEYSRYMASYERQQRDLKEYADKLLSLDVTKENYVDRVVYTVTDMNTTKSFMKDDWQIVKIIKPILEAKEKEGLKQDLIDKYIEKNKAGMEKVIAKVKEMEQEALESWGGKYWDSLKPEVREHQIKEMHKWMLMDVISILMDKAGDILEVDHMTYNGNGGFDGYFKGTKENIQINTVMAGGYNIQRLHYRTLVYKWYVRG